MTLLDFLPARKAVAPAPPETRSTFSVSDPALAAWLGIGNVSAAGVSVTEWTALGVTAVYRCVSLISGAIAGLPLKSYRTSDDMVRSEVPSMLDDPGGIVGLTPFAWKEIVMLNLLLQGNAYLVHVYNAAGGLIGLQPVHPMAVMVKPEPSAPGGKTFQVTDQLGHQRMYSTANLTHIKGMGNDGLMGLSPITVLRSSLGTSIAADNSAARMFSNGLLLGGIVSSDETLSEEQGKQIKDGLKKSLAGSNKAGDIAVVNTGLKFSPWQMNAHDAQFIESRGFQIAEIARIFGVPLHLLAEISKETSWGMGIQAQNTALARYTLQPWTGRIEEQLSTLLSKPRHCEFDYKGLMQGTPMEEAQLLGLQLDKGMITIDEARAVLNLPPMTPDQKPTPPVPPALLAPAADMMPVPSANGGAN